MKNILLVEDEENLVDIVASVLEEEGFSVQKSKSAEEALAILPDYIPDLIISDMKMGKIDGFAMLEKIRGTNKLKDIPFICVTALSDSSSELKAKKLGATAYVTKPFDIEDLLKVVKKALLTR